MGASRSNKRIIWALSIQKSACFYRCRTAKILKMRLFSQNRQKRRQNETRLTKRQKTTCIYFDEASSTVEIQTHNTALKKRLAQYAAAYPDLCRQTDDDEQGGLTFEIDRRRFAVRLTAPYSDERRNAASELAKKNGLKGRV